jgi:hypothetical protein
VCVCVCVCVCVYTCAHMTMHVEGEGAMEMKGESKDRHRKGETDRETLESSNKHSLRVHVIHSNVNSQGRRDRDTNSVPTLHSLGLQ